MSGVFFTLLSGMRLSLSTASVYLTMGYLTQLLMNMINGFIFNVI